MCTQTCLHLIARVVTGALEDIVPLSVGPFSGVRVAQFGGMAAGLIITSPLRVKLRSAQVSQIVPEKREGSPVRPSTGMMQWLSLECLLSAGKAFSGIVLPHAVMVFLV